ncbi:MAG: phosphonoacetaldehyde hydrolase [Hyphomicrobiales bacterium]|nr:phosphonoacetaldehyde hydrolase [Hyphomicrobiales bacterium]
MGKLKAVVFDWAGTMIDFGSRGPMGVFVQAFAKFGVDISIAEARGPMGKPKRDHIADLLAAPRISEAWAARHGLAVTSADIDAVYDVFVPMNEAVAADFADLIPGALEAVAACRARGVKIGSTTGYTRGIMARILPVAAAQGYTPDNLVCAGDLAEGRPSPLMMYRTFADLGVYPPAAVVKVDDTAPGILEGLAAGTWTVAVAASGNETGLSLTEWQALDAAGREAAAAPARAKLKVCGAHYVIDSVADLISVIDEIERRIASGETPVTSPLLH